MIRASTRTAAAVGLLMPLLINGTTSGPGWPVFAALIFVALLFGVIGTEVPAAAMVGRDLSPVGWPRNADGWAIYTRASLRLAALVLGMLVTTLALLALNRT